MAASLFYSHYQAEPYFNMAFDEWLLSRVLTEPRSAFLRLYSWHIGAITIGCNQNEETALDRTRLAGTPVVRRITGGRALYHDPDELTYCIAAHTAGDGVGRLSGSLSHTSAIIAEALTTFLDALGIQAAYERQSSRESATPAFFHKAPCFASVAKYEVVAAGAKIIASAQKRVAGALLQHGSIKLTGVVQHPALNMDTPARSSPRRTLTPEQFLSHASLFCTVMSERLGVPFEDAAPAADESGVTRFLSAVQKNPLHKRDIVKQTFGASSL